jgi:hypothetical protein
MSSELLAIVEVDRVDRVACQAAGCGHSVYRRIHVVRHDGTLGVYGSDCFARLFSGLVNHEPRYGGGAGRDLTAEERRMLVENTARLIAQFEVEQQQALEQARLRRAQAEVLERAAAERAERAKADADRRRAPTAAELASVEEEAKRMVRAEYDVDPNLPGWRGLVLTYQRKLLGR